MGSSSGGSGQASSSGRSKPGSGNASVSSSSSRSGSSSSSGSKDSSKGSSSGSGSRSGSGRGSGGGGSRSGRGSGRGRGSQPLPSSKKSGGSSSGGGADCALRLFGIKVSAASDPGKVGLLGPVCPCNTQVRWRDTSIDRLLWRLFACGSLLATCAHSQRDTSQANLSRPSLRSIGCRECTSVHITNSLRQPSDSTSTFSHTFQARERKALARRLPRLLSG